MVEEIEKSLPFWVDRMGFTKTVDVPEGDRLGFAIVVRDGAELMLQSIESVRKDAPQFVPKPGSTNVGHFYRSGRFADILKRLEGYNGGYRIERRSTGCVRLGCSNRAATS